MILVDVHQRDVFDELVKKKIKDMDDFEWLKQESSKARRHHDLLHHQIEPHPIPSLLEALTAEHTTTGALLLEARLGACARDDC